MTSINDGKNVKSISTTAHRGKTYYIELYKSLEAQLSGDSSLQTRTRGLCDAWQQVHSLCLHSSPSTHPHLLFWLQRHTARTILLTEWQSPKSAEVRASLLESLAAFIQETQAVIAARNGKGYLWEHQLVERAESFKTVLPDPWGHPVLRLLLDPNGEQPDDVQILEWLGAERGVMFVVRLCQLAASKCNDLALALATAVMDRARASQKKVVTDPNDESNGVPSDPSGEDGEFISYLKNEAGFSADIWELLKDIELVLLHKLGKTARCIELVKQAPLRNAYNMIERLRTRLDALPKEKKLWKNSKDVAILVAQVVVTRCMVAPACAGAARALLFGAARALARLAARARLAAACAALAAPAASAAHLHTLAAAVDAQCGNDMRPFVCELYIRAITAGMNELERFKLKSEKDMEARSMEKTLSSWFLQLSEVLKGNARVFNECVLTAFSVHPSMFMYEKLTKTPVLPRLKVEKIEHIDEIKSEFGSWATDSRSTKTNFVKTSETLNLKLTQQRANVLSTAVLSEGEGLGLSPELCQDLAVLLSGPRLKTLSWDMDREQLLEKCRLYMERTDGGTRSVTKELKYLNLDPSQFQHLPEEDDDDENNIYYGIEKGYEHLVEWQETPEEIWQDAYNDSANSVSMSVGSDNLYIDLDIPHRRNEYISSDDDADPLSILSEEKHKNQGFKKERPHSKERSSKERKHREGSKSNEHRETSQSKDRRKDKSKEKADKKKGRKKRDKTKAKEIKPKPTNSMSHLIGMKVCNKVEVVNEEERKNVCKKGRRRIKKEAQEELERNCKDITDSDYYSQGKSSLASLTSSTECTVDSDVVFDGLFSMDELKTICPETKNIIHNTDSSQAQVPTLHKEQELRVSNGSVSLNDKGVPALTKLTHSVTPTINIPAKNTITNLVNTTNVVKDLNTSIVKEEVKQSITKLIQFRRKKDHPIVRVQDPNKIFDYYRNNVPNIKSEVKTPISVTYGKTIPTLSAITTNQQVITAKEPVDQKLNIANKKRNNIYPCLPVNIVTKNSVKSNNTNQDTKPVMKYSGKNPIIIEATNLVSNPSTVSTNMYPTYNNRNVQKISSNDNKTIRQILQKPIQHSNIQIPQKVSQNVHTTAPPIHQANTTSNQLCIQEFLKDLKETINAGTGIDNGKSICKQEYMSASLPTCDNMELIKAQSTRCDKNPVKCDMYSWNNMNIINQSSQCAKLNTTQKKVETIPNTYARLNYLHKNKQGEINKSKIVQSVSQLQSSAQDIKRFDQYLDLCKQNKIQPNMLMSQLYSDKSAHCIVQTPRFQNDTSYNIEKTNLHTKDCTITESVKPNKLPNTSVNVTQQNNNVCNIYPNAPRSINVGLDGNTILETNSYLTESDQSDILLVLRQQNKLNMCQQRKIIVQSQDHMKPMVNTASSSHNTYTNFSAISTDPIKMKTVSHNNSQHNKANTVPILMSNQIIKTSTDNQIKNPQSVITGHNVPNLSNDLGNHQSTMKNQSVGDINKVQKSKNVSNRIKVTKQVKQSNCSSQDWEAVMNQLLSHRTPSRGENALEMKLKKDCMLERQSMGKLRGQRIYKPANSTSRTLSDNKLTLMKSNITGFTSNNNTKDNKVSTISSQNKDHNIMIPTLKQVQNNVDGHNSVSTTKISDGDSDLLDELLDNDLLQEISELTSDEETYKDDYAIPIPGIIKAKTEGCFQFNNIGPHANAPNKVLPLNVESSTPTIKNLLLTVRKTPINAKDKVCNPGIVVKKIDSVKVHPVKVISTIQTPMINRNDFICDNINSKIEENKVLSFETKDYAINNTQNIKNVYVDQNIHSNTVPIPIQQTQSNFIGNQHHIPIVPATQQNVIQKPSHLQLLYGQTVPCDPSRSAIVQQLANNGVSCGNKNVMIDQVPKVAVYPTDIYNVPANGLGSVNTLNETSININTSKNHDTRIAVSNSQHNASYSITALTNKNQLEDIEKSEFDGQNVVKSRKQTSIESKPFSTLEMITNENMKNSHYNNVKEQKITYTKLEHSRGYACMKTEVKSSVTKEQEENKQRLINKRLLIINRNITQNINYSPIPLKYEPLKLENYMKDIKNDNNVHIDSQSEIITTEPDKNGHGIFISNKTQSVNNEEIPIYRKQLAMKNSNNIHIEQALDEINVSVNKNLEDNDLFKDNTISIDMQTDKGAKVDDKTLMTESKCRISLRSSNRLKVLSNDDTNICKRKRKVTISKKRNVKRKVINHDLKSKICLQKKANQKEIAKSEIFSRLSETCKITEKINVSSTNAENKLKVSKNIASFKEPDQNLSVNVTTDDILTPKTDKANDNEKLPNKGIELIDFEQELVGAKILKSNKRKGITDDHESCENPQNVLNKMKTNNIQNIDSSSRCKDNIGSFVITSNTSVVLSKTNKTKNKRKKVKTNPMEKETSGNDESFENLSKNDENLQKISTTINVNTKENPIVLTTKTSKPGAFIKRNDKKKIRARKIKSKLIAKETNGSFHNIEKDINKIEKIIITKTISSKEINGPVASNKPSFSIKTNNDKNEVTVFGNEDNCDGPIITQNITNAEVNKQSMMSNITTPNTLTSCSMSKEFESLRKSNSTSENNKTNFTISNITYLDSKVSTNLSNNQNHETNKTVKLTMSNGKSFKATIVSNTNIDPKELFDNLNLRNNILNQMTSKKRYTVSVHQISNNNKKIIGTDIKDITDYYKNKEQNTVRPNAKQQPLDTCETINLISDDEEDVGYHQFNTEFGTYRVFGLDNETFLQHQKMFSCKCEVVVKRDIRLQLFTIYNQINETPINKRIKKAERPLADQIIPQQDDHFKISETQMKTNDTIVVTNDVTSTKIENIVLKINKQLSDVFEKLTNIPNEREEIVNQFIEINDSSNDSVEMIVPDIVEDIKVKNVKPSFDLSCTSIAKDAYLKLDNSPLNIIEAKNNLLKDLGLFNLQSNVIKEDANECQTETKNQPTSSKNIVVKLVRCDPLCREYEKRYNMVKKCYVNLVRCDNLLSQSAQNETTDEDYCAVDKITDRNCSHIKINNDYSITSPVMRVYDMIASLGRQIKEKTRCSNSLSVSKMSNNEQLNKCDAEWFTTKCRSSQDVKLVNKSQEYLPPHLEFSLKCLDHHSDTKINESLCEATADIHSTTDENFIINLEDKIKKVHNCSSLLLLSLNSINTDSYSLEYKYSKDSKEIKDRKGNISPDLKRKRDITDNNHIYNIKHLKLRKQCQDKSREIKLIEQIQIGTKCNIMDDTNLLDRENLNTVEEYRVENQNVIPIIEQTNFDKNVNETIPEVTKNDIIYNKAENNDLKINNTELIQNFSAEIATSDTLTELKIKEIESNLEVNDNNKINLTDEADIILKGIEYTDTVVGTCYVFMPPDKNINETIPEVTKNDIIYNKAENNDLKINNTELIQNCSAEIATSETLTELKIKMIESNLEVNDNNKINLTDEADIILKGIEYRDTVVGTCYVFMPPDTASEEDSFNDSKEEFEHHSIAQNEEFSENVNNEAMEKVEMTEKINENVINNKIGSVLSPVPLTVIKPKKTYIKTNTKTKDIKRKIGMTDITLYGKFRKSLGIDAVAQSITKSIKITSYKNEFKYVTDYYNSVKFSFDMQFHKNSIELDNFVTDSIEVDNVIAKSNNDTGFVGDSECNGIEFESTLFKDENCDPENNSVETVKTFLEEISEDITKTDIPLSNSNEQNLDMGFGERSGRVIHKLKYGCHSNLSAATLSDVKHNQPCIMSEKNGLQETIDNDLRDQIIKLRKHFLFINIRERVRRFFEKSSLELNYTLVNNDHSLKKQGVLYSMLRNVPGMHDTDYIKPHPVEHMVQVVQVGQLPVSAAAQNPVSCDSRVSQATDASPSQCSVDSSPHNALNENSQTSITKTTEYTELTNVDLSMPIEARNILDSNESDSFACQENLNSNNSLVSYDDKDNGDFKHEQYLENHANESTITQSIDSNQPDESIDTHYQYETNNGNLNINLEQSTQVIINPSMEQVAMENNMLQQKQENGSPEKNNQIANAMNAAGIATTNNRAQQLVNIFSQKFIRSTAISTAQNTANTFSKSTSINAMAIQQALAQILPPPLNHTTGNDGSQQSQAPVTPQVLHIVQGKNPSGNQITLVDNSQQSVINSPNATQVLHIVQNKNANNNLASNGAQATTNSFSGISLVDTGLQQGNQLLHIVNTGTNQKGNNTGQLLKRVNLLTNLTNVQGTNEQKMVQFVCKSADGKAIQLNAPHQRSMVLRLQPIETSNVQSSAPKQMETQPLSPTSSINNSMPAKELASTQQEIKSRSIYEENYAKFIQNTSGKPSNSLSEKSTSLPKFNQAFGKPVFQDGVGAQKPNELTGNGNNLQSVNSSENSDCSADNTINLEHIGQISSPPLLLRKSPAQTSQAQSNLVQHIKQTLAPMNIQTMHGGVIYTRQIPVNIGGGQTINLITVPSTELIDDKQQQQDVKFVSQGEMEQPSIIKIVPQNQTPNAEVTPEDGSPHLVSSDNCQNQQVPPVLTQMRIKLPMLSKTPQVMPGARVVRPSFFQIQRNVLGGPNQPVYQQLVLTAAPPLGPQTIRLPQPTATATRQIKIDNQANESQLSSSTLEQLREFDMVLEQVKERSTVQPGGTPVNNTFPKAQLSSTDVTDSNVPVTTITTEHTQQVLYSIGGTQALNVAYVNRKTITTTPTAYIRSPDSSGIIESSTSTQIVHNVIESPVETQPKPAKIGIKAVKSRPRPSLPNALKVHVPPKTSTQKPLEDEQTTQRILYILAEYKEQVENSPDKDKPAPRRRSNPPTNPPGSSKRKKSSSSGGGSSRRPGFVRDPSPIAGDDPSRTMGSEDSSCGTSQGDCNESCSMETQSPQDSPRKVARKLFEPEPTPTVTPPRPQPQRNVIVADGQTITVARGTGGKPATAVLMPTNYILPVSMVKSGQQIAIMTNRGPKLLTVGQEGGAGNALLLQRLIGPAGLKPVLTRPGVRQVRLPTAALHNLQAFNLAAAPPVHTETLSPSAAPTPPELIDTRAASSPWADHEIAGEVKVEDGSSPEGSEAWRLPSASDAHDYTYEDPTVTPRHDHVDRTVLDTISGRYSPDVGAQRIFDKMFDIDAKKAYIVDPSDEMPRVGQGYDIDGSHSDCDDKPYYQVVQKKDTGSTSASHHNLHRLTHVSTAALRHKYAILEHELRLQKSLSEECEDLGVDSPSASELFPEAELLFSASPAHDHSQEQTHPHTQSIMLSHSSVSQPDLEDQIASDQLIPEAKQMLEVSTENKDLIYDDERQVLSDVNLGLGDVGIVTVSEDGLQTTIALDHEEFARSHPNTTFHSEPTEETELPPFSISGLKGRHVASAIYHPNGGAATTVLMAAPAHTVLTQAGDGVKYDLDNVIDAIAAPRAPAPAPAAASPERHAELYWESASASASGRSDGRRPDFGSDSDKCCKSPSLDGTDSTDSSAGARARVHSVIREARGRGRGRSRSASAGSSADDAAPPVRTYPAKRAGAGAGAAGGKTRAGEGAPAPAEPRRRASGRGVVKRGCHCCNGAPAAAAPAPPRAKRPRQRKPALDFAAD